ncbi:MAG: hypothetical protein ABH824_07070 [Nanoarchaeota archaeon]
MEKRGQAEIWTTTLIFEVVLGVLISVLLVGAAVQYASVSEVSRVYVERDLSLLIETMYASAGDIDVSYSLTPAFKVDISDSVKVKRDVTAQNFLDDSYLIMKKSLGEDLQINRVNK